MADKKRLLLVSHGFPPYYGGAEHAAGYLAAAAQASGRWQVQVLTSDIGGRLPAREVWEGCDIIRVHTRKKEWAGHTLRELLSFIAVCRTFKPEERPDFIMANCALPSGDAAKRLSAKTGVSYGVILHGSDVPGHQKARFGLVYHVIRPWIRRIWRKAAWVSAVSRPLQELAEKTWPEGRIDFVPNGVDTQKFHPEAGKNRAEEPSDGFTLVCIAQLTLMKGIQHLLRAISELPKDQIARLRLVIYGTGPYQAALEELADELGLSERVEFAGLVDSNVLSGKLRAADGFVLPSLREGLPLSLLEAMACGLPVVISAIGGIPDVVRDGENGLLVQPGDETALTEALRRILSDGALRARLSSSARETALQWSWARIWEQYEALMAENPSA